jgi:hypothetical protein
MGTYTQRAADEGIREYRDAEDDGEEVEGAQEERASGHSMAEESDEGEMKLKRRRYPFPVTFAEQAKRYTYDDCEDEIREAWDLCTKWYPIWAFWFEQLETDDELSETLVCALESWCDSCSSFLCAISGQYKAAFWALRSMLELSLTCVAFSRRMTRVQKYHDAGNLPPWKHLSPILSEQCFADYSRFFRSRNMNHLASWLSAGAINRIYRDILSGPTHSALDWWNLPRWDVSMAPAYNSEAFRHWFRTFKDINQRCLLIFYLAFPTLYEYAADEINEPFDGLFTPWQQRYLALRRASSTSPPPTRHHDSFMV